MYYKIYGITDCPSCLNAQALLMELDKQYVFINCDFSETYRNIIKDKFSWSTFPIVVACDHQKNELIGGYEQLLELMNMKEGSAAT
tara:strand:- start:1971 stop:2228 length:258 start_codon:yes stop_codon:yes gene_type:complete